MCGARRWLAAAGSRAGIAGVCGSATVPRCRLQVVGQLAPPGIDTGTRALSQQASSGAGGGGGGGKGGKGGPSLGSSPKTANGARELYDHWAEGYDDSLTSWGYPAPSRSAATLHSHGVGATDRILDVGCGTGMVGSALRAAGLGTAGGVHGIDISQASLDLAAAKPGQLYTGTAVANLDAPLALATASFDAAVCVGVVSYVARFDVLFRELVRVLRPGGIFVCTHRRSLWDADYRGCRTEAETLAGQGAWTIVEVGEPEQYMPECPDPVERAKSIRMLTFRTSE